MATLKTHIGPVWWDNHICMDQVVSRSDFLMHLGKVKAAGVDVVTLNIAFGPHDAGSALATARIFSQWIEANSDTMVQVRVADDVLAAAKTRRLGICFDVEGMQLLDGELDRIDHLYEAGVRWMLVAYNRSNAAGGGCLGDDTGLTKFGREAIARMNEVGMTCCASHCGYRTARDIIDLSAKPVIFSHSNSRALCEHPRNIPDDLMRACAARGGVVGINGYAQFLGSPDNVLDGYVAHVRYALDLIGDQHVGIGLDYCFDSSGLNALIASNPDLFPGDCYEQNVEMVAPWELAEVGTRLLELGYSKASLRNIFGGNHLRIAREVWA